MIHDDSELLKLLYQGSLQSEPWKAFLKCYRLRLRGEVSAINLRTRPLDVPHIQIFDGNAADLFGYIKHYHTSNPFQYYNMQPGEILTFADIIDRQQLERSEFYRQYLHPSGFAYTLRVCVAEPGGRKAILQIIRTADKGDFDEKDKQFCRDLLPHLEQAMEIYTRLQINEAELTLYQRAIDHLAIGVIVLDGQGDIVRTNASASRVLEKSKDLYIHDKRLAHHDEIQNNKLKRLIKKALMLREANALTIDTHVMNISKLSLGFGLLVRPLPKSPWHEGKACPSVSIYITDPSQHKRVPEEMIVKLFGLTHAEAVLTIQLTQGATLKEAATILNISEHTARNHCKRALAKTGVSRQTDLVQLILNSVATLG